jgi:hypothetical protein
MKDTKFYLTVGYIQIIVVVFFFVINIFTLGYYGKKAIKRICKTLKLLQNNNNNFIKSKVKIHVKANKQRNYQMIIFNRSVKNEI